MVSDAEAGILDAVKEALQGDGWTVEGFDRGGSFALRVDHALSGGYTVYFNREAADNLERLRAFLDKFEFDAVRERPAETPHATLLSSLRQAATGLSWDKESVVALSRILLAHGVLEIEEATWLEYAGPSWSDPSQ
jgi:hypothetical protein